MEKRDEIIYKIENGVGTIKLNRPKALNALSENMIKILYKVLSDWKDDKNITLVLIEGEGEKAFCAGGDMRALYDLRDNGVEEYAETFFAEEYRMNMLMHNYTKPVIIYMNGYVMGGGIGITTTGSHRIVNEKTKWAMPEMNIGFYPDVGGSYFLSKMRSNIGRYLALSSEIISGEDALYIGEADYYINSSSWDSLKKKISTASWTTGDNLKSKIDSIIEEVSIKPEKSTTLLENEKLINEAFGHSSMEEITATLKQYSEDGNEWAEKTLKIIMSKSPVSQKVTLEQLIRGKEMSLEECFKMEMNLSLSFMSSEDFYEGTRSVLVDKDRNPKWNPDSYEKLTKDMVDSFFNYQWKNGKIPDLT
ncbi:MAG: enoyl-CoA hydratase/isomerase family protein [Spirochaetales bacterium]|nr:enoyl-CoA hydratase/isomerase family protein [Spirochaetales bacterium]